MKVTYLIIIAIIVLILLAIRYQHNERRTGIPDGTVKICSSSHPNDCHYVDEQIVNAVYTKALELANADQAQTFPVEAVDDWGAAYEFNQSTLFEICRSVANSLHIDISTAKTDRLSTINELILFLHTYQINAQQLTH